MTNNIKLNNEITIDLSHPLTTSHSYIDEGTRTLQYEALGKLESFFDTFINNANKNKNKITDFILPRQNNCIFINGERGAGKTTFLLDILEKYKQETKRRITPIAFIDPTLIQTDQHIFVEIITKIYNKTSNTFTCGRDAKQKRELDEILAKMSIGLKLLTTNKHNTSNDASWFLEKSLNNATSGQCLEENFHLFIDKCIEILDTELFIFAIDDVDTKTDKAIEVLELIRCYLTHPKLTVIVSGDLQLYSHIIQNHKRSEILVSDLNIQSEQKHRLTEKIVEHLEQQYLSKIFPIEQRISLKKMVDLAQSELIYISYNSDKNLNPDIDKNQRIELKKLLGIIVSSTLKTPLKHVESFLNFILNQPIRSILQIIKSMLDNCGKESRVAEPATLYFNASHLKEALSHIFIGEMLSTGINPNNLTNIMPETLSIGHEAFKLIEKNNDLETGFYLRPDSSHDKSGYNSSKLYLSTVIATSLAHSPNKMGDAISLMLTLGGSVNIYTNYVLNSLKENYSFINYIDYIGLSRNESVSNTVAHFSPIVLDSYDPSMTQKSTKIGTIAGIIRMPRTKSTTKQFHKPNFNAALGLEDTDIVQKKDYRIANISSLQNAYDKKKDFALLDYISIQTILISSQSAITTTTTADYISSYTLLSSIAELLACKHEYSINNLDVANSDEKSKPENLETFVFNKFKKLRTIQTYIYPTFLDRRNQGDPDETEDAIESKNEDFEPLTNNVSGEDLVLRKLLTKWIEDVPSNISASPLLLGKMWTRIHYNLIKISDQVFKSTTARKGLLLPDLFTRFIWSIINSILIEECRYIYHIDKDLNKSNNGFIQNMSGAHNTTDSPKKLIENIDSLYNSQSDDNNVSFDFYKQFPFTYALISCPLLWPFLLCEKSRALNDKLIKREIFNIQDNINITLQNALTSAQLNITSPNEYKDLTIAKLPIMGCFRDPTGKGGIATPSKQEP